MESLKTYCLNSAFDCEIWWQVSSIHDPWPSTNSRRATVTGRCSRRREDESVAMKYAKRRKLQSVTMRRWCIVMMQTLACSVVEIRYGGVQRHRAHRLEHVPASTIQWYMRWLHCKTPSPVKPCSSGCYDTHIERFSKSCKSSDFFPKGRRHRNPHTNMPKSDNVISQFFSAKSCRPFVTCAALSHTASLCTVCATCFCQSLTDLSIVLFVCWNDFRIHSRDRPTVRCELWQCVYRLLTERALLRLAVHVGHAMSSIINTVCHNKVDRKLTAVP